MDGKDFNQPKKVPRIFAGAHHSISWVYISHDDG